jgi:hypothetical protein
MNDCLGVARKGLAKLSTLMGNADDGKEVKVLLEANKIAMETIRRIRGLDDPTPPNPDDRNLTINIKRLTSANA